MLCVLFQIIYLNSFLTGPCLHPWKPDSLGRCTKPQHALLPHRFLLGKIKQGSRTNLKRHLLPDDELLLKKGICREGFVRVCCGVPVTPRSFMAHIHWRRRRTRIQIPNPKNTFTYICRIHSHCIDLDSYPYSLILYRTRIWSPSPAM